jgi:hypothetical protein
VIASGGRRHPSTPFPFWASVLGGGRSAGEPAVVSSSLSIIAWINHVTLPEFDRVTPIVEYLTARTSTSCYFHGLVFTGALPLVSPSGDGDKAIVNSNLIPDGTLSAPIPTVSSSRNLDSQRWSHLLLSSLLRQQNRVYG